MRTLILLAAVAAVQEQVENPQYAAWSTFKPGSKVVLRYEAKSPKGAAVVSEITGVLKSVDEREVVLAVSGWIESEGQPRRDRPEAEEKQPSKIDAARLPPAGRVTEEEIEVGGRKLKCRLETRVEPAVEGDTVTKIWTSPEVPGGVVRREVQAPDGTTSVLEARSWEAAK